jgi:hypothetical protein
MKKSFYAISALLIIAMLIAGCAGAPAAPTAVPQSPADPAAPAEVPAKQNITLTYMASQGWIKDAELELAKQFEEETGIHVDYQIIPADQYFNVLRTKLNSGEATDIFGGQSGKTDLQVQYDVEQNAVDLTNEEWTTRMDPLSLDMVSLNGKVYGAEIWDIVASNYFVMVYNKTIFEELGLSVPQSYADFKAACETILAAGKVPVFQPISDGWHHVLWFPMIGPRFEEVNPGLSDALNANNATFAETEIMRESLEQLNDLYNSGCFGDNALSDAFDNVTLTTPPPAPPLRGGEKEFHWCFAAHPCRKTPMKFRFPPSAEGGLGGMAKWVIVKQPRLSSCELIESRTMKSKAYPLYFTFGALFLYLLFFVLPSVMGFYFAFTDWNSYNRNINWVGLDNFRTIFASNQGYMRYVQNTVIFTIATIILKTGIALGLAVLLTEGIRRLSYFHRVLCTCLPCCPCWWSA